MDDHARRTTCALRVWSVVGTILLLSAVVPVRAGGRSDGARLCCAWASTPCMAASLPSARALPPPPAGEGQIRPGHFSVAPVLVIIERSRWVGRSRFGGLYGP